MFVPIVYSSLFDLLIYAKPTNLPSSTTPPLIQVPARTTMVPTMMRTRNRAMEQKKTRTSPPPLNDEVSTLSTSRSPTNSNLQQLLHEAGEENKEKKRQQLGEPKQHNTSIITIHSSDASCSSASTPNKTKKAQQKADQCHSIDCRRPHYKMRGILKRSAKREKIKLAKKEKEYCRGGGKSQDLVAVLGSKLKEIELKECH